MSSPDNEAPLDRNGNHCRTIQGLRDFVSRLVATSTTVRGSAMRP